MADKYLNADGLTYYNQKINQKINGIAAAQGDGKSIVATDGKLAVSYGGQHIYAGEEVVYEFKSGNWEKYGDSWLTVPQATMQAASSGYYYGSFYENHNPSMGQTYADKQAFVGFPAPNTKISNFDPLAEYKIRMIVGDHGSTDPVTVIDIDKSYWHEDLYAYRSPDYYIASSQGFIIPTDDQPISADSTNYLLVSFTETDSTPVWCIPKKAPSSFPYTLCYEFIVTKINYNSEPINTAVLAIDNNTFIFDPITRQLKLKTYNNASNNSVSFNDVYANFPDSYSTCFNTNTTATNYSLAAGTGTIANNYSVAMGHGKIKADDKSIAWGVAEVGTTITSSEDTTGILAYDGATAHGYGKYMSGTISGTTEKDFVRLSAHGKGAHAEGYNTQALHVAAHTSGNGTKSALAYQTVCGQVNKATTDSLFVVGNGTYGTTELDRNESNALECRTTGTLAIGGSLIQNASDYAECFEWYDGNKDKEDRIGYIVTLEGNKIRFANSTDDILGIISGTAGIIGNAAELDWKDRYLTDEYGRIIYDEIELEQTTCDPNDPEKEIVETIRRKVPRINPDFDSTLEYVPRTERPEWGVVGLMGQIYVRDNGLAVIGGYVTPTQGIATPSLEPTRMRVMERINDHVIRVFFK